MNSFYIVIPSPSHQSFFPSFVFVFLHLLPTGVFLVFPTSLLPKCSSVVIFSMFCSCLYLESGHLVDYQSDPKSVHGGLPALLAAEETQQEDDP